MSYIGNSPGVASQRVTTTLTATAGQTQFTTLSGYILGYVDVYLNGAKLVNGTDFEAITGTYITLFAAAEVGDVVELVSYVPRGLTDGYTKPEADARFLDITSTVPAARMPALTGDITTTAGTVATTLATVNSNVGAFGSATAIPVITVNAKGLITAVSTTAVTIPSGSISVTGGDITLSGNTGTAITNATLATVNSNVGAFGSASAVPVITVNAKGLITAISTTAVTIPSGSISVTGGDITLSGDTGTAITNATLATVNSNVGTFNNVTVNAKGLVTAASNVSYLTSFTEADTLATVTGRGATTSTLTRFNNQLQVGQNTNGTAWIDAYGGFAYYGADSNSTGMKINSAGTAQFYLDARAPIFYDSNDTTYYLDPNSRSVLSTLNVGSATTIGTGKLSVFAGGASAVGWATGFNIGDASNYTTWIQDAGVSRFRNTGTGGMDWYSSSAATRLLFLSDAGSFNIPAGDIRSPIFYDYNDTAYYLNPYGTSNINQLNMNGPIVRTVSGQGYLNGNYPSSETVTSSGAIYSIGGTYVPGTTTLGNMYGIGYAYSGSGRAVGTNPAGAPIDNWGLYGASNGVLSWFLSSSVGSGYFTGTVNAPIFYDKDNTSYYLDPNSTTSLRTVGDWRSDSSTWSGEFSGKMQYHSNHWYIQAADLFIYRNASGSNVFTINQSGSAVASADMRAPIFYDSDNTAYYTNPAGVSVVSDMRINDGNVQLRSSNVGRNTKWRALEGTTDVGISLYNAQDTWCMQLYANAGTDYGFLNGNWASWDIRKVPNAALYMNNNNSYYLYTNSRSSLYTLTTGDSNELIYVGTSVSQTSKMGIGFNTTDLNYAIYKTEGSWVQPLNINFWTGIRLRTNPGYDYGTSFWHTDGTLQMSVGQGDNNVRVFGDLRVPLIYDSNNTGYYVDANSTSRMGTINADVLYSYGNVTAYSDERLKKDWETLPTNFVEELAKIKSGTYTRIDSGERQVGVGAQSLQAILKEAVSEKEEYLGVHYGNTAMVSAVELAKEVVKLKELLTKQQTQIEEQNKRIAFLETK